MGLEWLKWVKRERAGVSVVVMSGLDIREEALGLGADGFVLKPDFEGVFEIFYGLLVWFYI